MAKPAVASIVCSAIIAAGGKPEDIIRTRIFLTKMEYWKDAARAHGDVFAGIMPACSFIGVSSFIDPDWLVEVEADAVVSAKPEL